MKTVGMYKVSDKIESLISENLLVHPTKPMTFMVKNGTGKIVHSVSKFMDLQKYFSKYGIEMKEVGQNTKGGFGFMMLEVYISDPLAGSIEKHLEA